MMNHVPYRLRILALAISLFPSLATAHSGFVSRHGHHVNPQTGSYHAHQRQTADFYCELPKISLQELQILEKRVRDASAAYRIATVYFCGSVSSGRNLRKALDWAEKSAYAGSPDGALLLSELYGRGQGTPKDLAKAQAWFWIAQQLISAHEYIGSAAFFSELNEATAQRSIQKPSGRDLERAYRLYDQLYLELKLGASPDAPALRNDRW